MMMKWVVPIFFVLTVLGCATQRIPRYQELKRIHYSYYQGVKTATCEKEDGFALTIWLSPGTAPSMHYAAWPQQVFATRGTNLVFMSEQFRCELSTDALEDLYGRLRDGCLPRLQGEEKPGPTYYFGWLTLETDSFDKSGRWYFRDTPRTVARQYLHEEMLRFIAAQIDAHPEALERTLERFQGDGQAPVSVTLADLIQNADRYNGKRVRVSGYHHAEFEHSSLSSGPDRIRDYNQSIWLGGASNTAKPSDVAYTNDTFMTVEGTFTGGGGGHLGLWPGAVDRLTKIEIQKKNTGVSNSPPVARTAQPTP